MANHIRADIHGERLFATESGSLYSVEPIGFGLWAITAESPTVGSWVRTATDVHVRLNVRSGNCCLVATGGSVRSLVTSPLAA